MGKKPNIKPIGSELLREETKILYNLVESIKVPNKSLNAKIDAQTKLYCEGKISDDEFFKYLDGTLNENWLGDVKNWVVQKVVNVLFTILQQAIKTGYSIVSKVISAVKYIMDKINAYADKNPKLWRIIVITVIIFIMLIVCAASAKAATTGSPPDKEMINQAIGLLKSSTAGGDNMIQMKAMAYLVKLRDGATDVDSVMTYGKEAIQVATNAISALKKAQDAGSGDLATTLASYASQGAEIVGATLKNAGGSEAVKLIYK